MDNWNRNDENEYRGVSAQRRNRRRTDPAVRLETAGEPDTEAPIDYSVFMRPQTAEKPEAQAEPDMPAEYGIPEEPAVPAEPGIPAEPESPVKPEIPAEPKNTTEV